MSRGSHYSGNQQTRAVQTLLTCHGAAPGITTSTQTHLDALRQFDLQLVSKYLTKINHVRQTTPPAAANLLLGSLSWSTASSYQRLQTAPAALTNQPTNQILIPQTFHLSPITPVNRDRTINSAACSQNTVTQNTVI